MIIFGTSCLGNLYRVITISSDGHLKVEGQKSGFHLGITPRMAGYAPSWRPTTPEVSSFELMQTF